MYYTYYPPYLCHHGIKGQKWGLRRYQNPDGTLTDAGRKRYIQLQTKIDRFEDLSEKKFNKPNVKLEIKKSFSKNFAKGLTDYNPSSVSYALFKGSLNASMTAVIKSATYATVLSAEKLTRLYANIKINRLEKEIERMTNVL